MGNFNNPPINDQLKKRELSMSRVKTGYDDYREVMATVVSLVPDQEDFWTRGWALTWPERWTMPTPPSYLGTWLGGLDTRECDYNYVD